MRRIVVFGLLLCFFIPLNIEAKKKPFGNGMYWEVSKDGTLSVSGNGEMPSFSISKHAPWEEQSNKIVRVVIENGITSIGDYAFYSLDKYIFTSAVIPPSVTKIGKYAFSHCRKLASVSIPNGITQISEGAFDNTAITSIVIPTSVKTIGVCAFENTKLSNIVIPNSVKSIKSFAFYGCRMLSQVTLPVSLDTIAEGMFEGCVELRIINTPPSLKVIEKRAFMDCKLLTSTTISDSVYSIGDYAFCGCEKINIASVPKSVRTIGDCAFSNCNLQRIKIPDVIYIGKYAFAKKVKVEWLYSRYVSEIIDEFDGDIDELPQRYFKEYKRIGLSQRSIDKFQNNVFDSKGRILYLAKEGQLVRKYQTKDNRNDNIIYYTIEENGKMGLMSQYGQWLINIGKYAEIINIGGVFFKVKDYSGYGVFSLDGKEIIPTSRGYTYIGDFDSSKGTFAFTKKGFSGVCDAQGREISTTRIAPTADDIKANGGYASAVEMKSGSTIYYKVSKTGRYGLTNSEGKEIVPCEMEALESAGTGYLKYKINGFWGVMNYTGKIIIPTDRGYTSIGDFVTFTKHFPYTMVGYKGECDINGRQISKIKVATTQQSAASNTSLSSSSSNSSPSSSSSSSNSYPFTYSYKNNAHYCEMEERQSNSLNNDGDMSNTIQITMFKYNLQLFIQLELFEIELINKNTIASWANKTGSNINDFTMSLELSNGTNSSIKCAVEDRRKDYLKGKEHIGALMISFKYQSSFEQYDIKSISYDGMTYPVKIKTAPTIKSMADTLRNK